LLPFLKKKTLAGLTAIGLLPEGACVVQVERTGGRAAIGGFDFQPWDDSQEKLLARLAAQHQLKQRRCTTVLDATDYSLLLTEAPDVPADELRSAIRWRIKDLIDFHINDATLDVFEVPGDKAPGRARPMYAVAARSAAVQKRAELFELAGINLEIIDIPEMAQRNVAALLPEDARGVALLSLAPDRGLVTVTRQGELYLSRNLEMGVDTLLGSERREDYFDRIVLEVQRSLDYYESQLRQPPVTGLVIAPTARPVPGLVEHLKANLSVAVSEMDLNRLLDCRAELTPAQQAVCFSALGAALRQEEVAL
jgi:MSHA biogenesis protein MshI